MINIPKVRKDIPKYQIFPAIGIARVGDSRRYSYIAAEAPQIDFVPQGGYRGPHESLQTTTVGSAVPPAQDGPPFEAPDDSGLLDRGQRIKRMGCRFRIYEFHPGGMPFREINADNADIEWRVELANKKAAGAVGWGMGQGSNLLNPELSQTALTIKADEQALSGIDAGPLEMGGEIGEYTPSARYVKLGDLTTDDKGRLIVYGGHGVAESWEDDPVAPRGIRNAGWYDDTSDGIVKATVTVDGVAFEALAARIIVGPPDYVHPCLAPVTLFDLAFDRKGGWHDAPPKTSFTRHIHPILHRSAFLEWTLFAIRGKHYGRAPKHGHGFTANHDMHPDGAFMDPRVFDTLHDKSSPEGERRRQRYFDYLKDPSGEIPPGGQGGFYSMPAIEGLTFTQVQHDHFRNLLPPSNLPTIGFNPDFDADWPIGREPGVLEQPVLGNIPVSERPAAHNRAAMDFAVGGPFFPGVEVGAIATEPSTYFSISPMGPEIDFRVADEIIAGDLTASLALPWQTTFNQHNYRTTKPSPHSADNLWPSARPVLVAAKESGTTDDMLWTRPYTESDSKDIFERQKMRSNQLMIDNWSKLGFIAPATFYIEVSRTLQEDPDYPI